VSDGGNMTPVIEIKSLSFSYTKEKAHKKVLNELSLSIKQGELVCLLGANGAGKSTLINLLLGRLAPQSGHISIFGQQQGIREVRQRLGVMLQDSTAPDKASVRELLVLFSSYFEHPIELPQLIAQLNLEPIIDQYFVTLSGGQKQLVLLALALCGDPDLLFLDEPSVGMDVTTRRVLWQVIERYKSYGKTIVLTTHYLEEADALADRVVVLKDGAIVADNTPQQLKTQFAHKLIKAKTCVSQDVISKLEGVVAVSDYGRYIEVTSQDSSATLKHWMTLDPAIEDLTISNCDLEQAFLQITNSPISQEQVA